MRKCFSNRARISIDEYQHLHIPDGAARKAALQPEIDRLATYYSYEAWKADFAADEAGLLPAGMKRGVLSEDGVYGVLERFGEMEG